MYVLLNEWKGNNNEQNKIKKSTSMHPTTLFVNDSDDDCADDKHIISN